MSKLSDYPQPSVTVDLVIFTIAEDDLKVLLIRRGQEPFKGRWALPGGFVEIDESLERAAARELKEEVGVTNVYLEQLYTFGEPKRDPRGRVISVSYFALVDAERQRIVAAPTPPRRNGIPSSTRRSWPSTTPRFSRLLSGG